MSDLVPFMRGYRPSRRSRSVRDDDENDLVRLENLERYVLRARAGMPLFEEPEEPILPAVFVRKFSSQRAV